MIGCRFNWGQAAKPVIPAAGFYAERPRCRPLSFPIGTATPSRQLTLERILNDGGMSRGLALARKAG